MKQKVNLLIKRSRALLVLTVAFAGFLFGGISLSHYLGVGAQASTATNGIQINVGGSATGSFVADTDVTGGTTSHHAVTVDTSPVSNPPPQAVYQDYRFGNFTYSIPNLTPNASYTVRLDFAEVYWSKVGSRVFNVSINGQQVLSNFDIIRAAGKADEAIAEPFSVKAASTGKITIQFTTVKDNALVNAIEVFAGNIPTSISTSTPTPTLTQTPTSTSTSTSGSISQSTQVTPPPAPAGEHTFSFRNTMNQTIWVGMSDNKYIPLNGGWALAPGASMSVELPDKWNGRIWGRTGCTFNSAGVGSCETGDCQGRLQCAGADGALPRSLGEFNLNAWDGMDFYDVSLVDGYNLPMFINTFGGKSPDPISTDGCISRPASAGPSGCLQDINASCPSVLQEKDASGKVIGCQVACNVFHTDQYCCRGPYEPRAMCNPANWPVDYAKVFKDGDPEAYSYPDDDATSTFTCNPGTLPDCNYRITFGLTG